MSEFYAFWTWFLALCESEIFLWIWCLSLRAPLQLCVPVHFSLVIAALPEFSSFRWWRVLIVSRTGIMERLEISPIPQFLPVFIVFIRKRWLAFSGLSIYIGLYSMVYICVVFQRAWIVYFIVILVVWNWALWLCVVFTNQWLLSGLWMSIICKGNILLYPYFLFCELQSILYFVW